MTITGRIYKIKSAQTDKVYIGSTLQTIQKRFLMHKRGYKNYQKGKGGNMTSYEILKHGDATIELIDEREYETKDELQYKEREYIELHKNAVNKQKPLLKESERDYYDIYRCKCECGGSYVNKHKASHMRTKMHKSYEEKEERAININITFNMTINDSEVKIITNGNENI
jgi:hypothetical protein